MKNYLLKIKWLKNLIFSSAVQVPRKVVWDIQELKDSISMSPF